MQNETEQVSQWCFNCFSLDAFLAFFFFSRFLGPSFLVVAEACLVFCLFFFSIGASRLFLIFIGSFLRQTIVRLSKMKHLGRIVSCPFISPLTSSSTPFNIDLLDGIFGVDKYGFNLLRRLSLSCEQIIGFVVTTMLHERE